MGDRILCYDSVELVTENQEKPLLDNRLYRVIGLSNQLDVFLIHDPDTSKAAAAMDVNVGSLSDPKDMLGTAQAVQHFCFMETKKARTDPRANTVM